MFKYRNVDEFIDNVNSAVHKYADEGYTVIYVAEVIPDKWFFRKAFGHSIEGTDGVKLVGTLDVVSENYFEKMFPSAFKKEDFCNFLKKNNITELKLCGLDEAGCVGETAKSAAKLGYKTELIRNAVATSFPEKKILKMRAALAKLGVCYTD